MRLKKLKTLGVVVKKGKREAAALAAQIEQLAKSRKIKVVTEGKGSTLDQIAAASDLVVVVGGDGTFLTIARRMARRSVPILGVNLGQLGFLTEIKKDEALATLEEIFSSRQARVSERVMLEVELERKGKVVSKGLVVNDAVISKGAIARMIEVQVTCNGHWVHRVRADGMIIATPTGSTAYSLAAGGPILAPSLPVMILSPICPHALTQRPLVVADQDEIVLELEDRPGSVILTLDGQEIEHLKPGDRIHVKKSPGRKLLLVSSPARDYFTLLREKFKFGMRA